MPEPYDYTSAFANVPAPADAFMQGIKNGAGIQQLQFERQQQQAAQAQAQQQRADLAALSQNPTPQAVGALMVKYPGLSEQLKRASDVIGPAQQQAHVEHASQVYAAVLNGQPDIAEKLLTERATALRNSGNEQGAAGAEAFAKMVHDNPAQAKTVMGLQLASAMGPDKFASTFKDIGSEQRAGELQGDLVRKGEADADAAVSGADSAKSKAVSDAVTAKYADQGALLDLQKKGWDIKQLQADIDYKKQSIRIETMKVAAQKADTDLKRQELQLKINDAVTARDDKLRAKVADAESGAASIDNMLNNIDRILNVATDKSGKPTSTLRATAGPLDSRLPTMQGDVADLEALVDTLGSQAFLSQIPNIKGMGALSNAEGEKLQSAFQNFSLKQSPEQIVTNLKEAQRLLKAGRGAISKRYGVPLGNPNTPAAADSRPPLSSFGG